MAKELLHDIPLNQEFTQLDMGITRLPHSSLAQRTAPGALQLSELTRDLFVLGAIAQGLADEDEKQEGKAGGQGGDDGDQGFFGFGLALRCWAASSTWMTAPSRDSSTLAISN